MFSVLLCYIASIASSLSTDPPPGPHLAVEQKFAPYPHPASSDRTRTARSWRVPAERRAQPLRPNPSTASTPAQRHRRRAADVERRARDSLYRLDAVVHREAVARLRPVDRATHELNDDADDLVNVPDELPGGVTFPGKRVALVCLCKRREEGEWVACPGR